MAYLATTVRCHHRFEGLSWVFYDTAYRRRAAKQKDLNWSVIDSSLFNSIFTGKAKATTRCIHCLSEEHTTEHCPSAYGPLLQLTRDASVNLAASLYSKPTPSYQATLPLQKFAACSTPNAGPRCTYGKNCKFSHTCKLCGRFHPKANCPIWTSPHSLTSHSASMPSISSL